ncbi:hypothetical protein MAPG_11269 [Magnaporthiopsis poae ATCC 64411]|uniref:Uncharacterized protein n=1 Tax=Magnaporthiopsis poae (strain ATCC 64411 / 73-15) TaxID=644358 RepID=A0A0C4EET8_MAGP6|nr:hypothetical protein MAPG_11269 [Magnaporthiopsis poae ATCC 64411]
MALLLLLVDRMHGLMEHGAIPDWAYVITEGMGARGGGMVRASRRNHAEVK